MFNMRLRDPYIDIVPPCVPVVTDQSLAPCFQVEQSGPAPHSVSTFFMKEF